MHITPLETLNKVSFFGIIEQAVAYGGKYD